MADEARIEQFRKLAEDNPGDELAHLGLGNALMETGRHKEAAQSYQRVLALNGQNSKAHQMLGEAQKACGDTELAIQTLRNGYLVAHKRGDLQPMNAMAARLRELGAEVPSAGVKDVDRGGGPPGSQGDAGFACSRCGGRGPRLASRPFKGPLGERVLASVCQSCWREWVGMGTKVINELRLPMHDPAAQDMYDRHMKEFLGLED